MRTWPKAGEGRSDSKPFLGEDQQVAPATEACSHFDLQGLKDVDSATCADVSMLEKLEQV